MVEMSTIETDGFAIVPQVFSDEEISVLAEGLSNSTLPRGRAGIRHGMSLPLVREVANSTRLLELARHALGGSAFPFRATLFEKSGAANWLVAWHQDTALPLRERRDAPGWGPWSVKQKVIYAHAPTCALEQIIALRVHLDDSLPENGPLRVIPRSHKNGVLSDDIIYQLAATSSAVDCIVPKGGILAMHPLIIHASSKSQANNRRRVLHIEYAFSLALGDGLEIDIA